MFAEASEPIIALTVNEGCSCKIEKVWRPERPVPPRRATVIGTTVTGVWLRGLHFTGGTFLEIKLLREAEEEGNAALDESECKS